MSAAVSHICKILQRTITSESSRINVYKCLQNASQSDYFKKKKLHNFTIYSNFYDANVHEYQHRISYNLYPLNYLSC